MARKRGKSDYNTVLKNRDKNYISDCWLEFTKLDEKELSEEFIHAMLNIKLWQQGSSDCFGTKLIELIAKADFNNKMRLSLGFNEYVNAYSAWYYKEINGKRFKNDRELFEYVGV